MSHIMIDLETLGTRQGSVILAIGAVKFDPLHGVVDEEGAFYATIDPDSCLAHGMSVDGKTLVWWMEQDAAARRMFADEASSLASACVQFADWVDPDADYGEVKVWGNGAGFDQPLLAEAYRRTHITQPWMFWNERCYRTLKALFPQTTVDFVGTRHNALHDAIHQAKVVCEIYRRHLNK